MNETQEAVDYIISCCPNLGSASVTSDVDNFLSKVADEMEASSPTPLFPARYKEHVACALKLVASYRFLDPPAAVASVYLATRFEFYFRMLSGKLKADGTWISTESQTNVKRAMKDDKRINKDRISSVALAYRIMKLDDSRRITQVFNQLDKALSYPYSVTGGKEITDIGARIEWARIRASHGELGDISAEATFYGLITAIVFFNQAYH